MANSAPHLYEYVPSGTLSAVFGLYGDNLLIKLLINGESYLALLGTVSSVKLLIGSCEKVHPKGLKLSVSLISNSKLPFFTQPKASPAITASAFSASWFPKYIYVSKKVLT